MNASEEISRLFELYHDVVFKQCLRVVGYNNQYISIIDDSIQYAFMQALLKWEEFIACANPVGWLCVTAKSHLMSEIRKFSRRSKVTVPWYDRADEDASLQLETDIERWHNRQNAIESIEKICSLLSPTEKSVYDAYLVKDQSIDETAKELNMSRGAVRGAIDRIRAKAKRFYIFPIIFLVGQWIELWRSNI